MRFCGRVVDEGHSGPCGAPATKVVRSMGVIPGHTPAPDIDLCDEHADIYERLGIRVEELR